MKSRYLFVTLFLLLAALILPNMAWCQSGNVPGGAPSETLAEHRLCLSVQKEQARIRKKEVDLQKRGEELKTLEAVVDKKLAEMKKLRTELKTLLTEKNKEEAQRVDQLSAMYQKMDPAKAAALLVKLKDHLAAGILAGMRSRSAGQILNNMDSKDAARLSKYFSDPIPVPRGL